MWGFNEQDFHQRHPGGSLGDGLRPIKEILRFRVGENVTVLPDSLCVGDALKQSCPGDSSSTLRHAGAIMLVDGKGALSGIFTDGDLRRLVMSNAEPMDTPIADIMTRSPRHLRVDHRVADARRLVAEHRIDEIPVVDEAGHPVGLIDVQDLLSLRIVTE